MRQLGLNYLNFEEEIRSQTTQTNLQISHSYIDPSTGQYYKSSLEKYKFSFALKFFTENQSLIDDQDLIYITYLRPLGKVVQFCLHALIMVHLGQLYLFMRVH
jgi:hypothetical protein